MREVGLSSVGIALEDALAHHAPTSPPGEQQQHRKYQAGGPYNHQDEANVVSEMPERLAVTA
jgi:hypothetical protein